MSVRPPSVDPGKDPDHPSTSAVAFAEASRRYVHEVVRLLDRFAGTQGEAVSRAATAVADSLATGGVLHVFGSGHSQMAAQEIYLRAGGLAVVNAILDGNLSFYGSTNSDRLERLEGYADILLMDQDLRAGEVFVVVSNSGLNPVPIEAAQVARDRGCTVVAITSAHSYAQATSRHSSGVRLSDVAHIVIDTGVPLGDAILAVDALDDRVGAVSTAVTAVAMQAVVVEAISISMGRGQPIAVLASANVPGGDERNAVIAAKYRQRLPNMRL